MPTWHPSTLLHNLSRSNKDRMQITENTKRWLISSAVTFVSGFSIAMLSVIDDITLETVRNGAVVAVVFTAIRAGLKGLLELWGAYKVK